jgi:periplasmic divalent cation tolerance protein
LIGVSTDMDGNTGFVVLLVTAANAEEARRIAEVLLKQRKAACVNIVPKVSSLFWWQDEIDSAEENLLIVKTKALQLNEVIRLVKENHSYEIPAVIALPIVGGNQDYLDWIGEEVK